MKGATQIRVCPEHFQIVPLASYSHVFTRLPRLPGPLAIWGIGARLLEATEVDTGNGGCVKSGDTFGDTSYREKVRSGA